MFPPVIKCDHTGGYSVYLSERPYHGGKEAYMEDKQIVDLFWQRSEAAIVAAASKYGKYCSKIAYNILQNYEDSEECVNDIIHSVFSKRDCCTVLTNGANLCG